MGDWVLLKLQPYRQRTIRGSMPLKLSARYFGLYQVIDRIGQVAYKLRLPETSQIHNVFHMSLLKKYEGDSPQSAEDLPYMWEVEEKASDQILDRRMVKKKNRAVTQVLIKWKGSSWEDATWEDYVVISIKFPDFNLVG